jgi:hypothetical protein
MACKPFKLHPTTRTQVSLSLPLCCLGDESHNQRPVQSEPRHRLETESSAGQALTLPALENCSDLCQRVKVLPLTAYDKAHLTVVCSRHKWPRTWQSTIRVLFSNPGIGWKHIAEYNLSHTMYPEGCSQGKQGYLAPLLLLLIPSRVVVSMRSFQDCELGKP